jgi:hypothetical protein
MSTIITRAGKGSPLTNTEVDANFTNLNTDKLESSEYTASDVLDKIKTVDGSGSGLDADLLDGNEASAFATSSQGSLADSALQPSDNISELTNNSGYITGNETITLSGDVSGSGTTSIAVTITKDPVITLSGAVTGSATMTNLGNVTISTTATSDPTLTLAGDLSGSATFTNLGNATLTATVADDSHNHVISNVDGLQTALDGKLASSLKGAANGLAELDANGLVPASQLPSYVDDVLEYANFASLPVSGETGKIYVTLDDNDIYRWSGSAYIKISDAASTADQANTLATARTIALGGVLSGSASFDGSSNITITAAHTSDPVITLTGAVTGSATMTNLGNVTIATTATSDPTLTLTGDATGSATFTNLGNATLTVAVVDDSHTHDTRYFTETESDARFAPIAPTTITIGGITVEDSADRSGLLEINRKGVTDFTGTQARFSATALWSVMGNETQFGAYDDANSEWIWLYTENGALGLYHNGVNVASTTTTGLSATTFTGAL